MFSTVPTALGKLGKLRTSFPQFPQPLRLVILTNKKRQKQKRWWAEQIPMDKLLMKR